MAAPTGTQTSRSPFAAAFLSLLFPGLGQAYAGAPRRGLLFAIPPLLGIAALFVVYLHYGTGRFGLWLLQSRVLLGLLLTSGVLLLYRGAAILDAYGVAQQGPPPPGSRSLVLPDLRAGSGSAAGMGGLAGIVGLVAVFAVLIGGHAAFAKWDNLFYNFIVTTHNPEQVLGVTSPTQQPGATAAPVTTPAPWTGSGKLNILLVGVDARPADKTFNTDSMIVVSVDPVSRRVAMLSLPRDVLGVPTPPGSGIAALFGPTYNNKINSLWALTDSHRDLYPGGGAQALKQELGYIYGIDIQYYVEVNFEGFRKVVDTMGGVTLNVDSPVVDDDYPGDSGHLRIYIQPGLQHMNGAEALIYARSRHGSNDFDRAARQQKVLIALRQGADLRTIGNNLEAFVGALQQTIHTDLPEDPDLLGSLLDLANKTGTGNIKQYVFAPPAYGIEHFDPTLYWIEPNIPAIRAAAQDAMQGLPAPSAQPPNAVPSAQPPNAVPSSSPSASGAFLLLTSILGRRRRRMVVRS